MAKKLLGLMVLTALILPGLGAQADRPRDPIGDHYAASNFLEGDIPQKDLEAILYAGIHAPSANNRQPWHFTVVRNLTVGKKIVANMKSGNVLIIVSSTGNNPSSLRETLDCGLATESLYLAAQNLGYGSRIYTGPMDRVNKSLKTELGMPEKYNAVALVRVGKVSPDVDVISAASSRKAMDSLVTYK